MKFVILSNCFFQCSELWPLACTHGVISNRVHRLLVSLSHSRPERFVQFLYLTPFLVLLLYLLVSIDLVYTGLCELVLGVYPEGVQLYSKFSSSCSVAETTSSFSTCK